MDYKTLGQTAISHDAPEGRDVRYDDSFLLLQAEIDKLASPADRASFSWQTVAGIASNILAHHSKDLLVASYLSVALIYLDKADGFETALTLYHDMLTRYWNGLFPPVKRMKGRIAALEWWLERTGRAVDELGIKPANIGLSKKILEKLTAIDGFLSQKTEHTLSLLPLIRTAETWMIQEKPVQPASAPVSPSIPAGDAEVYSFPLTGSEDMMKNMAPLFLKIKQASVIYREEKDHDPQAYRWLRFAVWEPVKSLPPAVNEKTKLPQPEIQALARLESLMADEDWKSVLETAESALFSSRNLFLLDLNYCSWKALSQLGEKYKNAKTAVLTETFHFIKRLEGLEHLLFSDGTPFASEKTINWLTSSNINGDIDLNDNVNYSSYSQEGNKDELTDLREQIKTVKNLAERTGLIQEKINGCSSGKTEMALRLEMAGVLFAEKQDKMAAAQIEHVIESISVHHLTAWDPEYALKALLSSFRILKKNTDARYKIMSQDVLAMIAKINVTEALKLK